MSLDEVRQTIADIDFRIIELIAERQKHAAAIGRIKHREGLPIHDEEHALHVLNRAFDCAVEYNIDPVNVQRIFEILIEMSEEWQHGCAGEGNLP